jgi:DNA-binding Lrp family transcriptional regulator
LRLTKFQKQLCNALQKGLPICRRPFAEIAQTLHSNETETLQQARQLQELGLIRRVCAIINHRALGLTSTLVAAHVPEQDLAEVVEAVNSLENISHNYSRGHHYNLWFTLQAQTTEQIRDTLLNLGGRFGVDFHSLPIKRVFKLDVRFDAENQSRELLRQAQEVPKSEPVELDEKEKLVISKLQNNLELTEEPFAFLCGEGLIKEDALKTIEGLIDKGVIRRIAVVVDHRKLGFTANVLFAGEVPQERIVQAGQRLAHFAIVSHCYERETFEDWPYNLFAMMHGQSMGQIQRVINKFTEVEKIKSFQLLPTANEFKKQPVRYLNIYPPKAD